ncbi:MAG: glycosyltransferase family 4 protein [Alphaproteobacteria bacterium]
MLSMLYVMGFAAALSMAVSGFMIHVGIGDIPVTRSSHKKTTATCGGLGLVAAIGGFFLIMPQFFPATWLDKDWPFVLTILWAVAILGLVDDIFAISAKLKFAILAVLAVLAVWKIGPVTALPYAAQGVWIPYVVGFIGSVLWIFVTANAVNFMDGSNGLMACVMIIALIGLAAIGTGLGAIQTSLLPLAIAAGLIGFLPYNLRRSAHVFSGDVGSLVTGFGFAMSVLWLCRERPDAVPVLIGPVLILPFLTDVLLTMIWRVKQKENLLTPHKHHLYQRLIARGHSHVAVALYYSLAGMLCALTAYGCAMVGFHKYTAFIIFPAMIMSTLYYAGLRSIETRKA